MLERVVSGAVARPAAERGPASNIRLAAAVAAVLALVYVIWQPRSPDLAAQFARADLFRRAGNVRWWTGWFGGVATQDYSIAAPAWMATVGIVVSGVLAVVLASVGLARLVRDAPRARAGAVAFCCMCFADVVVGRTTFAIGVAVAVWSLVALQARRPVAAAALAIGAALVSPLAGLFLGLAMVAVALTDRQRRAVAVLGASALVVVGIGLAVAFPSVGTMPFGWADALRAAACCAGAAVLVRVPAIRVAALLTLAAMPVLAVVPGAIGANIARLAWMCTVPLVIAYARVPARRLVVLAVLAALWPGFDIAGQLESGAQPSSARHFYAPLLGQLAIQMRTAGPTAAGERIELVDTANHWGTAYLSQLSLARVWDRQVDVADNPIFYTPGALTPTTYRRWLDQLAVGWVALPNAPLDYAAKPEARLLRTGLPYMRLVWRSAHWSLYRVESPVALIPGARVVKVTAASITVQTVGATQVTTRLRYLPGLAAVDPATGRAVGCIANDSGWASLRVARAETLLITARGRAATDTCP